MLEEQNKQQRRTFILQQTWCSRGKSASFFLSCITNLFCWPFNNGWSWSWRWTWTRTLTLSPPWGNVEIRLKTSTAIFSCGFQTHLASQLTPLMIVFPIHRYIGRYFKIPRIIEKKDNGFQIAEHTWAEKEGSELQLQYSSLNIYRDCWKFKKKKILDSEYNTWAHNAFQHAFAAKQYGTPCFPPHKRKSTTPAHLTL